MFDSHKALGAEAFIFIIMGWLSLRYPKKLPSFVCVSSGFVRLHF